VASGSARTHRSFCQASAKNFFQDNQAVRRGISLFARIEQNTAARSRRDDFARVMASASQRSYRALGVAPTTVDLQANSTDRKSTSHRRGEATAVAQAPAALIIVSDGSQIPVDQRLHDMFPHSDTLGAVRHLL